MRARILQTLSIARLATWLALVVAIVAWPHFAPAQLSTPQMPPLAVAASQPVPEPIYWKQDLFLIPYEFGSAAEPAAAQAVWLFVSKDRGANWQKISEARPQVKAFNYRAEGEGEYCFAIRTIDHQGRAWPEGPYQPELRVIVDTTIPRIEALRAQMAPTGQLDIAWVCSDANLDPSTLTIEAQVDAAGTWQPVPVANALAGSTGGVVPSALGATSTGRFQWQPPPGIRPLAIRAGISDRAKNVASYRAEIGPGAANAAILPPLAGSPYAANSAPSFSTAAANQLITSPATISPSTATSGWASGPAVAAAQAAAPPANQTWPSTTVGHTPFRISSAGSSATGDGVTTFGSPRFITTPMVTPATTPAPPADNGVTNSTADGQRVPAQFANVQQATEGGIELAPSNGPRFAALDPFRQTSMRRLPTTAAVEPVPASSVAASTLLIDAVPAGPASDSQIKRVGSRTFALEYDLDDVGRWGVSKVELWGTRDGGKTWHSFALDDDHRSPLIATVDQEGLYGFRIAVDIAGSAAATPPSAGDQPELWVSVDLNRPAVELTAIEKGAGNLADHLVFRWKAVDDNLEPRPISLFYSSRPSGPWCAIATNLQDTGEYTWRVERHVPARFFVRIEARDTAGNLAAFQTRDPIDFDSAATGGHLRSAEPIGPTADAADGAFR
jgi:hypothetical protein